MPARATPPAQPPPPPPSALADPQLPSDLLLYRLAKLAASSGRLVTRLLERRYGITRREWGVLMWLAREPGVSPSHLADALALDRARISRAIASLHAKGLLRKAPQASNRRTTPLHLSATGQQLHDALLPQIRAINVSLVSALDGPAIAVLDHSLQQLQQHATALELQDDSDAAYPPRQSGKRQRAAD